MKNIFLAFKTTIEQVLSVLYSPTFKVLSNKVHAIISKLKNSPYTYLVLLSYDLNERASGN